MDSSAIEQKLDSIIAILKLANADKLAEVRDSIRSNPGRAAILDATRADWVSGGELTKSVAKSVNKSERMIRNYVCELLDAGLLEKRGAGPATEYRSSGVL